MADAPFSPYYYILKTCRELTDVFEPEGQIDGSSSDETNQDHGASQTVEPTKKTSPSKTELANAAKDTDGISPPDSEKNQKQQTGLHTINFHTADGTSRATYDDSTSQGLDIVLSSTFHELCKECQDYNPRCKFKTSGYKAVRAEDTTWNLERVKQNQKHCSFCKFIITTLELGNALQRTTDSNAKVRASLVSLSHQGVEWSGGFQGIRLVVEAKDLSDDVAPYCILPYPSIQPLTDVHACTWWGKETHTVQLHGLDRRVNLSNLMTLAGVCAQIDQCKPHSEEVPGLRVIDIKQGCIVKAAQNCRYMALSYVWGAVNQMRLSKQTEELLTTPGSLTPDTDFLSKVVQDSLLFCDAIHWPFLWIDTLCIMQDDPQDMATQISYMDAVYLGAEYTIVAAAGSHCNVGLPGLRTDRIPKPTMATAVVDGLRMVSVQLNCEQILLDSVWSTRAWTLQEEIFSRKAFVFTNDCAFFACRERIVREDCIFEPTGDIESDLVVFNCAQPRVSWPKADVDTEKRHLFGTTFPREQSGADAFAIWLKLLPLYLKRNLTKKSDAINAFKGMLRALDKSLQGFRSGMPRKFFARGLLWHGLHLRPKWPDDFPTWSWAAWAKTQEHANITFQTKNDCVQWTPTFSVLDEDWESGPELNFREPERFGHSDAHHNYRSQEHFSCSQNPRGMTFNVDRNFKHDHFQSQVPEEAEMRSKAEKFIKEQRLSHVVFFHTSTLQLTVDRPEIEAQLLAESDESDSWDMSLSRCAIRSSDGTILDYISLDPAWRAQQPEKLNFVALFVHEDRYPPIFAVALTKPWEMLPRMKREPYHPSRYPDPEDSYAVAAMLVEMGCDGISRRVGIPEENAFYYRTWLAEDPDFKLVALG